MDVALNFIKELVLSRFGATGVLLVILCALAIYSWFQHNRAKLLQERIDLEAERRRQMAEELLAAKQVRPTAPELAGQTAFRILAADDEPSMLTLYEMIVRSRFVGGVLSTSPNGDNVLKKILAERPDLLLLDLIMPGKSGYDVLRELSVQGVEIPVIVISGYETSLEGVAQKAGVKLKNVWFLPKPFTADDLVRLINQKKS